MVLLSLCCVLLMVCYSACDDTVATEERRTRCLARCMNYDKDALAPYNCIPKRCRQCAQPCLDVSLSLSACQAKAKCGSVVNCNDSCTFIATMGAPSSDTSLLPNKPGIPQLNGDEMEWDRDDYQFYASTKNKIRRRGVLFLLLGSKAQLHPDGTLDTGNLKWVFVRHTPKMNATLSEIENNIKLDCGHSYVFKVAAFNELGTIGYNISKPYTTEELLNTCNPWHPIGSRPPAYCSLSYSFNRTFLNLNLNNSGEQDVYHWDGNCSDLKASRSVIWSRPQHIPENVEFCYEVYVTSLSRVGCEFGHRVYYVHSNETDIVLGSLEPRCNLLVALYAGTLEKSALGEGHLDLELNLKIPHTSPDCDAIYKHITLTLQPQDFNPDSELYRITLTWNNPPAPVDSFRLITQMTSQHTAIWDQIEAVASSDHVYTSNLDVKPEDCVVRIELQPWHGSTPYASSQLKSNYCSPALSPGPPSKIMVDKTEDSMTIHWEKPILVHSHYPITGYMVMWGDPSNDETYTRVLLPTVTEFTVTGLLPNHLYHFQVIALSDAGNSTATEWMGQRTAGLSSPSSDSFPVVPVAGSIAGIGVFIALVVIITLITIRREKRKLQLRRKQQLELDTFHPPTLHPIDFDAYEEPDEWEIIPENLTLLEILGEGFFGVVLKAKVDHNGPPISTNNVQPLGTLCREKGKKRLFGNDKMETTIVACKMLKENATLEDQTSLLKEIALMKKISQHKHIVSMLGCLTRSHPVCLLVEYCEHGDLLQYLRDSRPSWLVPPKRRKSKQVDNPYSAVPGHLHETEGYMPMDVKSPPTPEKNAPEAEGVLTDAKADAPVLSSNDLLSFAKQIALGMEYLGQKGLVHRDLACRNVLVAEYKLLKISDFGLTRAIYTDAAYTQKTGRRLPLKWMAAESIMDRVFTTQSDVWSFGIVLWEICTLGGFPYPTVSNEELLRRLRDGYRMERPQNCSEELYGVMLKCWHPDPNRRPSFSSLLTLVDGMIDVHQPTLYVDLDFDAHNQYWMSISEIGDSDSDAEPDTPFQETHLHQVSFGEDSVNESTIKMAKQALRMSGVDEEEIANDPFLKQASSQACRADTDQVELSQGYSKALNGDTKVGNGCAKRQEMNGQTVPVDGHSYDNVSAV